MRKHCYQLVMGGKVIDSSFSHLERSNCETSSDDETFIVRFMSAFYTKAEQLNKNANIVTANKSRTKMS